jgi:hypothetical protein
MCYAWKNRIITLDQLQILDFQDVYDIFSLRRNAFESIMRKETTLNEHLALRKINLMRWRSQYHKPSSEQFENWATMVHYSNSLAIIPLPELLPIPTIRWVVSSTSNVNVCTDSSLKKTTSDPIQNATFRAKGSIGFKKDKSLPLLSKTREFPENIISVSDAVENGFMVVFTKAGVAFYKSSAIINDQPVLFGNRCNESKQFYLDLPDPRA